MKTIRKKIGDWVEMEYDAKKVCLGLTWLRAKGGFGQRGDREDWVADVPSGCFSVSRYKGENWKVAFTEHRTFESAAAAKVRRSISQTKIELRKLVTDAQAAHITIAMLKKALTM